MKTEQAVLIVKQFPKGAGMGAQTLARSAMKRTTVAALPFYDILLCIQRYEIDLAK